MAPETVALLAGAAGGPANITNYIRGLNGIMVDIDSLPADAILTADDFSVRAASGDSPPSVSAAAPLSITIRRGAGAWGGA